MDSLEREINTQKEKSQEMLGELSRATYSATNLKKSNTFAETALAEKEK